MRTSLENGDKKAAETVICELNRLQSLVEKYEDVAEKGRQIFNDSNLKKPNPIA
jgi:hypothetical protein